MGLTKLQQMIWAKSRAAGSGGQAVGLTDAMCAYLIGTIANDLGLGEKFPELPATLPSFFLRDDLDKLVVNYDEPIKLFERLVHEDGDADMYYACLANLHKARLKYETILKTQPIPTLEQVGPRGLLQYGKLSAKALTAFLFWRKWFFDIDNRAGQETGYLFEPVIAHAIGGTPIPSSKSPVKRHKDKKKGRQVDCLIEKRAYEFKIRMTIAASGQGRWGEELDYPIDCKKSGYVPILLVLDSTPNPKLEALERAFRSEGGEVYIGAEAWNHMDELAGPTMSRFLDKYVRSPINKLISEAPNEIPHMSAQMGKNEITIGIGEEILRIARETSDEDPAEADEMPSDVGNDDPG